MKKLILIFAVASLSGCALFSSDKQPVIEDHINDWNGKEKIGILSTTAERREVVFKMPKNQFCAEAPPDIAESLSSSLSAMAQGSVKDTTAAEVTARLEVAKTFATTIATLFRRSQGVQLFRDGSFNLCEAYLNGAIDGPQYIKLHENLLKVSKELIVQEIPQMTHMKAEDAANNAASAEAAAKKAATEAGAASQTAKQAADRAEAAAKK
jgi:hypothetical protein